MALRQRTNAYWAKRANERLVESEKTSEKYRRQIRKLYTQTQRDTLNQLKQIYANYWTKEGGFDKQKLKLMTSSGDMNKFVAKLKKAGLYDKIPEQYLGRINRLEYLNAQMWYEAHTAGQGQDKIMTEANRKVYEDSYYRSIYDVSRGIGSTPSFTMLDKQTINQVLNTEFDGKNYSERIWGNSDILANQLKDKLAQAIANGQSIQKTAQDFRERFQVQNYYAERLIRTETNYFHNEAELESYESMGFEYYEFLATLDSRTSEICAEMDGKRFKVANGRPGENMPPMHPNCRSTIVPYFKGYEPETRLYRDPETGRNQFTYNMSYNQWHDKFVDNEPVPTKAVETPTPKAKTNHFESKFTKNYPQDVKMAHLNKLEELGDIFPEVRKEFNNNGAIITSNSRLKKAAGQFKQEIGGKPVSIEFASRYKTLGELEQAIKRCVSTNWSMPVAKQQYKSYVSAHEFGHALENNIINKIRKTESNQRWAMTRSFDRLQKDKIESRIVKIARENNPNFTVAGNISRYGRKNSAEFFAETFANAFCGAPNELGKAMLQYLKEEGMLK